jgi:hypothetical protein
MMMMMMMILVVMVMIGIEEVVPFHLFYGMNLAVY